MGHDTDLANSTGRTGLQNTFQLYGLLVPFYSKKKQTEAQRSDNDFSMAIRSKAERKAETVCV